jgi:hypothetical protein
MEYSGERREEQRLRYHWPVWFAEDVNEALFSGQLVDVSSCGASFTSNADESCPSPGQHVITRFSVPCFGPQDCFDMANFARPATVCRVDSVSNYMRKIAVQFAEPLPFKPGEQAESESDEDLRLKAVTI